DICLARRGRSRESREMAVDEQSGVIVTFTVIVGQIELDCDALGNSTNSACVTECRAGFAQRRRRAALNREGQAFIRRRRGNLEREARVETKNGDRVLEKRAGGFVLAAIGQYD